MNRYFLVVLGLILLTCGMLHADCPNNLVLNGGFTAGRIGGAMPSVGAVSNWTRAYGTPDVSVGAGCEDSGVVSMWGNRIVGEAIQQVLPGSGFISGRTYRITMCIHWVNDPTKLKYIQFRARASNVQLTSPTDGNGIDIGTSASTSSLTFVHVTLPDWSPVSNYSRLTISATNNSNVNAGDSTSYGAIDGICVQEIETVNQYTITATYGSHGTITPNGAVLVDSGSSQQFIFSPDSCYHVDSLLIDGVNNTDSTTSYTFNNVSSNHTIRVVFAINQYTITATSGINGTIIPQGVSIVNCGADQQFTFTPNVCYHLDYLLIDGVKNTDFPTSYTFTDVRTNHTIQAVFAVNMFVLTATGDHGSVIRTPEDNSYSCLSVVQLTAIPESCCHFVNWNGDVPTGHETDNPLAITMDANKNLVAHFICVGCLPPPESMVAWWPGDYHARDIAEIPIKYPNNGQLYGDAGYQAGKVGSAFSFHGIGWVFVQNQSEINFGAGDFTIDSWIKSTSTSYGSIVNKRSKETPDVGYELYIQNGYLRCKLTAQPPHGSYIYASSGTIITDGAWHHVAVTALRSNPNNPKLTLYVDGRTEQAWLNPVAGNLDNTEKLYIGPYFNGSIDEVEMFNRALDSTEIYSLWNAGGCGKCKHDTVGTYYSLNVATVTGGTVTISPAQALYDSGSVVFLTAVPDSCWAFDYWSGDVPIGHERDSPLTITMNANKSVTPHFVNVGSITPPGNMVAWWPGDYHAKDIAEIPIGYPNNGTLKNGASYNAGKVGGAFSLDGVDDYVEVPDQSELNFGTGDFTIDAWINTTYNWATIVDKRTGQWSEGNPLGYALFIYNNCIGMQLADGSKEWNYASSSFPGATIVSDSTWHHVAATIYRSDPNKSKLTLYVDGKVEHVWLNPSSANVTNTNPLYIGWDSYMDTHYGGGIDEVEMFSRALDSTEIRSLWAAGPCGKRKQDTSLTMNCDSLRINLSQISDSCKWNLTITNPYWGLYGIEIKGLGQTVITNISWPFGWTASPTPSADVILTMANGDPIPLNQTMFSNLCLDASTQSPRIVIRWLRDDLSVVCADTFKLPNCGRDLQVSLGAIYPNGKTTPCCGQDIWYTIVCKNVGSMPISGVRVFFSYPKKYLTYTNVWQGVGFSAPTGSSPMVAKLVTPNPFPAATSTTPPGWVVLNLKFNVNCDPNSSFKPWIATHASILPLAGDIHGADNHAKHKVQVLCSHDPNDKLVSPHGCGVEGYISSHDSLTYTLHFQNTGTGSANLVVIRDTLDSALDIGTVLNIGSSHPNVFEINGRELKWTFSGIALPPKSDDSLGSNGFVVFSVKQIPGNTQGAVIQNRAGIYFDQNSVVMTNTTINTITYDPLPIADFTVNSTCISDTFRFDFIYTGGTPGATFLWDFGNDAIPETSSLQNPTGIRYTSPGEKTVLLQVQLGDCVSEPAIQTVTDNSASTWNSSYRKGWNMVSLPVQAENSAAAVLYPNAVSLAYTFGSSGYEYRDTIKPGMGYWLKFDSVRTFPIIGSALTSLTVPVVNGWNMVGSISTQIPVSSIETEPPGLETSQFFSFDNGYAIYDTLLPNKGYWVKTGGAGTLILSSEELRTVMPKNAIRIVPTLELPPPPPAAGGISSMVKVLPKAYALEQNYPNPFNPTTVFQYALPGDSKVLLTIFNLLGQRVATLVDGVQSAGYKSVNWNAGGVASGLYFYRIEATSVNDPSKTFTKVMKMALVK